MGVYKKWVHVIVSAWLIAVLTSCGSRNYAGFSSTDAAGVTAIIGLAALSANHLHKRTLWFAPPMYYSIDKNRVIKIETKNHASDGKLIMEQAGISAVAVSEEFGCKSLQFMNMAINPYGMPGVASTGKTKKVFYYKCSSEPDDGTRARILKNQAKYIQWLKDKGRLLPANGRRAKNTVGNAEMRRVQQTLRELGYDVGPADGIYGKRTRTALSEYQKDHGIEGTGRLDAATRKKLLK